MHESHPQIHQVESQAEVTTIIDMPTIVPTKVPLNCWERASAVSPSRTRASSAIGPGSGLQCASLEDRRHVMIQFEKGKIERIFLLIVTTAPQLTKQGVFTTLLLGQVDRIEERTQPRLQLDWRV
jgi:hypothetical protein